MLLVLALSFIFFGRREGQHWRDYKTPKLVAYALFCDLINYLCYRSQLQEYVHLRETQQHLRELSIQRQELLATDNGRCSSTTPAPPTIQSFLQPKAGIAPPPQLKTSDRASSLGQ